MPYLIERLYHRTCDMANTWRHRIRFRNKTLKCGKGVRIRTSNITFGHNVYIDRYVEIGGGGRAGGVAIGNDVQINRSCSLDCTGKLTIGDRVTISEEVVIHTHSHGRDPRSQDKPHELRIGSNTWIGMRSIVLSNARTIGNDVIIGAGAVVRNPVSDGEIFR